MTGVRGLYPQVAGVVRVTAGFEGDQVVVLGVAEAAGVLAGGGVGALLLAGLARFSWPVTLSGGRVPSAYPPLRQIVDTGFACVTTGEAASGVHVGPSRGSLLSYR